MGESPLDELLRRAESVLHAEFGELPADAEKIREIVHQLQLRQLELEMQNEELRQTHATLLESRDRYLDLYDFAPVGYATIGDKSVIVDANLTLADLLQVARADLVESAFSDFILEEDREVYFHHWRQLVVTKERQSCEVRLRKRRGDIFWAKIESVTLEHSGDGSLPLQFAISDVTERRRTEEALRQSEAKFRALVESSCDWIWEVNAEGVYTYASPQVETILGYKPAEVIGKTPFDLMLPEEASRMAALFRQTVCDGAPMVAMENVNLHKDGQRVVLETSGVPFRNDVGEVLGYRGVDRDITDRKRVEDALENRIVALTRPLDDPESIRFEELFNLSDIQRLQDEFAKAAGVASIITNTDGTPITAPSNFCRLCRDIIRETEKGSANCFRSDAMIGRFNRDAPIVQPCMSGGLWDAGAAISVGGRHVANWLIGQVRDETQTEQRIREYAREIGADEETAAEAFHEVPAMSREQFGQLAQTLFTLASQLSTMAYQNVQQARFITERKRAEDELLSEKAFSDAAIASLPGIFYVFDKNGKFLRWNDTLETVTGYSGEEIAQMHPTDFFPEEEQAKVSGEIGRVFTEGWSSVEANFLAKDGTTTAYFLTGARLKVQDNLCLVGVGMDIAERKRTQKEREHLIAKLEAQNAELERFTYTVSHDLRSPLVTIKGYVGLLAEDIAEGKPEVVASDLSRISNAADRMDELLRELLSLSRIGRKMNPPVQVSLAELAHEALEVLGGQMQSCAAEVAISTDLPTVVGDRSRLLEVLQNLIDNAIKYMGPQSQPRIEIGVRCDGDEPVFYVADNGIGIEPAYHERIFGLFDQLDQKVEGSGIGLSLVKRIVEVHGGRVWVESEGAGRGSAFCFTIHGLQSPKL